MLNSRALVNYVLNSRKTPRRQTTKMHLFRLILVLATYPPSANTRYSDVKTNVTVDEKNYNGHNDINGTHSQHGGIHVFVNMFSHVSTPFVICCWILLVSSAQVIFHRVDWLASSIPESCLLILLGIPVGYILDRAGVTGHLFLTSDLFFQYLLPPIIFDAGYFVNPISFINNIGTILLYAIVGTTTNTFLVGMSMYGVAATANVNISLLHSLVFGALISAVDPVAVLRVFEEVQVNEVLYMLVFGESVLNDAASVVLYRTFAHLPDYFDGEQVGLAVVSFFVVTIFGTGIGVFYGLLASFITKFLDHVTVLEPIFVFIMAWMAYLTAEMFHFSGIMSILFCGVVMRPYVESNISRKSHTTIKYFLKLLASSSEAVIFMFLGVALVQYNHNFNLKFIAWCVFFITIYRAIAIVTLTWLANKFGRLEEISRIEQLIMSYGGLRGAVAFCLAIVLNVGEGESEDLKSLFVTTTLAVIIVTCFVQGATMKILVEKLGVKRADQREHFVFEHLNDKVMSYAVAGIEEVLGVHGHGFWMNLIQMFNQKVMRPCLERNPEMYMDDSLFREERDFEYKHSISRRYSVPRNKEPPNKKERAKRPSSGEIPLLNRTLSSDSRGSPTLNEIDATDFTYLIPHATRVRTRRKYSDAHVGLDDDLFQWKHVRRHRRHTITSPLTHRHRHQNHRLRLIQEEDSSKESRSSGDDLAKLDDHADKINVSKSTAESVKDIEIEISPKQDIDKDNESSATVLFSRFPSSSSSSPGRNQISTTSSRVLSASSNEIVSAIILPDSASDSYTDPDADYNNDADLDLARGSSASGQTSGGSIVSKQSVIAEFDGTKDFACSLPWE